MCCLKYEHPLYVDFKKKAPRTGTQVDTPDGPAGASAQRPVDSVVMRMAADRSTCACSVASVCGSRQAYDATHGPA